MFQKPTLLVMLCIIIVFSSADRLLAQVKEGKVLNMSDRVGEKINLEERNYYQLFPEIKGFQSAVFLQLPDSSFKVKIIYQEDGTEKIRFQKLSDLEMKTIKESIDHFEEIQIGVYKSEVDRFTLQVESAEIYDAPPSLNPLKIFGEFLAGSVGSMAIGSLGLHFGYDGSEGNWRTAGLGFLLGSTIGSSLGVYLIGCLGDETGNLLDTFLGSVVGTVLCVGVIFVTSSADKDVDIKNYYGYIIPAQTVGAVYAFNKTRRLEMAERANALLYYKDSRWRLSYPRIYIKKNPLQIGDWIQTINLVTLDF